MRSWRCRCRCASSPRCRCCSAGSHGCSVWACGPSTCARLPLERHATASTSASGPLFFLRIAQQRALEALHFGTRDDLVLVRERYVVALDSGKVVQIVDHEASALAQAVVADVAHPVQALEARAVAQVEAGDGID